MENNRNALQRASNTTCMKELNQAFSYLSFVPNSSCDVPKEFFLMLSFALMGSVDESAFKAQDSTEETLYILLLGLKRQETFRVLKNKELKTCGEYRTQRLVLEAWDKLEKIIHEN